MHPAHHTTHLTPHTTPETSLLYVWHPSCAPSLLISLTIRDNPSAICGHAHASTPPASHQQHKVTPVYRTHSHCPLKASRKAALAEVERLLMLPHSSSHTRRLVVVDDNQQYRSMRYHCCQIARRGEWQLWQLRVTHDCLDACHPGHACHVVHDT